MYIYIYIRHDAEVQRVFSLMHVAKRHAELHGSRLTAKELATMYNLQARRATLRETVCENFASTAVRLYETMEQDEQFRLLVLGVGA
jgi:hypothetical protein